MQPPKYKPKTKKTAPRTSQTKSPPIAPTGSLRTSFTPKQLLKRFRKLVPARILKNWLSQAPHHFYQRAFTLRIILWYFIFQRLSPDHTLSKVLSDAFAGGADSLSPKGKALSLQLCSESTTALSDARHRLPVAVLSETLTYSARQIRSWVEGLLWHGWNVALLDGSTLRLRPHEKISREFPPHHTAKGNTAYWCLMRVVVAFCLSSGVVLDCAMGPLKVSEQALTAQLLCAGNWVKTLLVADRNFGVYFVVRATVAASAQILVRLTQSRARKLARIANVDLRGDLDVPISWLPSAQDQCPAGLARISVAGRLLVVRVQRQGFRPLVLYLFTTLSDAQLYPAGELAKLYGERWHIELDLRFVKTQLQLAHLESKSPDMVRKEWLGGLIAYNLIRSVMVAAAAQHQTSVLVLSFSRARQFLQDWLVRWAWGPSASSQSWEQLLAHIARCQLPRRSKPRPSEPRAIRDFKSSFPKLKGDRQIAREKLEIANSKN